MKKIFFLVLVSVLLCKQHRLSAQNSNWLTPGGIFDTVTDGKGNKFLLKDIRLDSPSPFDTVSATGNALSSAIGFTCNAGVFDVFFQNNMTVNGVSTPSFITNVQTVVCAAIKSISDFIYTHSLSVTGAPKINIFVNTANLGSLIANAGPLFVFPASPINYNQGFIDNQLQKMLLTSVDPYTGIPGISDFLNNNTPGFFHAYITLNSTFSGFPFNATLAPPTGSELDIFTSVIHEMGHCLGIVSLISANGLSGLSLFNNSYTRYDTKLRSSAGVPLLASSTGSCTSNLTYTGSLSAIGNATSNCTNTSNCTSDALFAGATTTVSLFTPNCFNISSLEHFEDMCNVPTLITGCTPVPASPGYNDLYYAMSESQLPGICGFKRYFQEEERTVFCDMGYSVNPTFSSTAVLSGTNNQIISYSSTCSPYAIVGQNDGLAGGVYIYTTTSNSLAIPNTSLLANDLPVSGLSVSCVEIVYTNSVSLHTASLSSNGSSVIVGGAPGSGLAVIKYAPINASGEFGNATYVFVYFVTSGCNSSSYCNMINNGGFEITSGVSCGAIGGFPSLNSQVNCWEEYPPGIASPSLYVRNCTTGTTFNLGSNTLGSGTTAINSYYGAPNDKLIAVTYTNGIGASAFKNLLASPLVPMQSYGIGFWALNPFGSGGANTNTPGNAVVITIACHTVFPFVPSGPFPAGLHTIAQFTIPAGGNWQNYSAVVSTPSTQVNLSALVIGINEQQTDLAGASWSAGMTAFCFLDDISLMPTSYGGFSLGTPTVCGNQSYSDLSLYTSVASTVAFTGTHVTLSGGLYTFNMNSSLSPGIYPIHANFTVGACSYTATSLVTVSSNTDFAVLSQTTLCSNSPTLDISALLYTTAAVSGGTFYLNGNPTVAIVSFTSPNSVIIGFAPSGTNLCSYNMVTATIPAHTVLPSPIFEINGNGVSSYSACGIETFTLTFSLLLAIPSTTYNAELQPGNFTQTAVVSPSASVIYTATVSDHIGQCPVTNTLAVDVYTNCCHGAILSHFTPTAISTHTAYWGPMMLDHDLTVTNGGVLNFLGSPIVIANNAKITVAGGGALYLVGAHLYTCDNNMWQGIVIQDGGYMQASESGTNSTMIEDAQIAIDISSPTTTSLTTILDLHQTVFNRNYIGVNISNYPMSPGTSTNAFTIDKCVFTSRSFTSNLSAWPNASVTSGGLRNTITGTTGLNPPYSLLSAPIANLKLPYTSQPSHIAIQVSSVGVASGTNMYGVHIGTPGSVNDFNLFDAHGEFIRASDCNLVLANNTFQNTQTYTIAGSPVLNFGGSAIDHFATGLMNMKLDMTATNPDNANRFWDCHRGIEGHDIYKFNIENNVFRSTQTGTNASGVQPGNTGIYLSTNRFMYYMKDNEFSNVANGVNISISANNFSTSAVPGGTFGIYATKIVLQENTFTDGGSTNNYMSQAINIDCPNSAGWTYQPDNSINPPALGADIIYNTVDNAFRGISVNNLTGFPTYIKNNHIALKKDDVFTSPAAAQRAIHFAGNISAANAWGLHVITSNTTSYTSANSHTNTQASLVFCSNNTGIHSPSVTCNSLDNAYQGFVFEGPNTHAVWAGNNMRPMARGFVLWSNGEVGTQGTSATASHNIWNGTWTGLFHTYVFSSIQTNSKLWVINSSSYAPTLNGTFFLGQNYASGTSILTNTTGGNYNCGGVLNNRPIPIPNENDYDEANQYYIACTALYRFLMLNDSVVDSEPEYQSFIDDFSGTSIQKFIDVEIELYGGDYSGARTLLNDLEPEDFNEAENTYYDFYQLFADYLENREDNEPFSTGDAAAAALHEITQRCPGLSGVAVFQARALYNTIYKVNVVYPECYEESGERKPFRQAESRLKWVVELYPNPTDKEVILKSSIRNEHLKIVIRDLSGRMVYSSDLKVTDFIANLDLNLSNGAYFITITGNTAETITKKLLISK